MIFTSLWAALLMLGSNPATYLSLGNKSEVALIERADTSFGAAKFNQPMAQAEALLIDIDAYRCEGEENCVDDTETGEFTDDQSISYRYNIASSLLLQKTLLLDVSSTDAVKIFAIGTARKKAKVLKNVTAFLSGRKPKCKTNYEQYDPPTYCVYALGKANVIVAFADDNKLTLIRMTFDGSI